MMEKIITNDITMSKTTVHQRFDMMIQALGLTKNAFAKSLIAEEGSQGIASTQVYNIINGRNAPSFDLLQRIAITFPTVNIKWLLTGKGQILTVDKEAIADSVSMMDKIKLIEKQLADLQKNQPTSKKTK